MQRGIHDVQGAIRSPEHMANLFYSRVAEFGGRTGEAIHAAHFLDGTRRDSKNLVAAAKQNDLFGA
jgi:hypothetical protein